MRLFMCHDYAPGGREIVWAPPASLDDKGAASLLEAYALGRLLEGSPPLLPRCCLS